MAVTARWYLNGIANVMAAKVDWVTDGAAGDIVATLHTASYTPNLDTHDFYDDLTNELSTGGGYTAGGIALANCARTVDGASDEVWFTADPFEIDPATFTCRYLVVRKDTGTPSTSPLLCLVDLGEDASPNNQRFRVTWPSTGVLLGRSVAA